MQVKYIRILFFFSLIFIVAACNNAKQLPKDQYLLKKNEVETNNPDITSTEVNSFIKQKPNKKIFGTLRFHLWIYTLGSKIEKDNKLKEWLTEDVGEKPVVLDTALANNSARQMEFYLENKGYFESEVKKTVDYQDNRKAVVTYHIEASNPYRINDLNYLIEDSTLKKEVLRTRENTLLKEGVVFDAGLFDDERERIAEIMKNNGYYYFNKNFIEFKIDSALAGRKLDVYMQVNNRVYKAQMYNDSLVSLPHHRFEVRNVYVYPDYDPMIEDTLVYDTLVFKRSNKHYHFIYNGKIPYKPKSLTHLIFVEPGEEYKKRDAEMTNKRLAGLQQFKYVNIEFLDIHGEMKPWFRDSMPKLLDCYIRLTRSPKQAYTFEWLGKNTSRDLGTEVSFIYSNKNLFRGSEIFNLNTNLALETQRIIGDDNNEVIASWLPFNTMVTGINGNLDIPKFLLPVKASLFPAYFKPHTNIFGGYNYRQRPDYTRHLLNFSFGYVWNESETKQWQVIPVDINSIKLNPDSSFIQKLNEINNKKFLSAYEDHLIVGGKVNFINNTQVARKKYPDFWYSISTLEFAGNILNATMNQFNVPENSEGYKELFKIRYAQYIRMEEDFRYFYRFNDKNVLATRVAIGVGIPVGNSDVLPFEKSFFVGGSNGIRAWQLRSLGPGGFSGNVSNFDKIGDISLETSIEYRFPIYDVVRGALFVDAGNVWLKDKNNDFPDGHFESDRFYKEIAVGTGFGVRLDFSFFVIRIDAGVKTIDPSLAQGNRWVLNQYKLKDTNINFGIGYPF